MKVIGITGGVGAGKTQVLEYLRQRTDCCVIIADQAAHMLEEPGGPCYGRIVELLGREILDGDGRIDRGRMASRIFGDGALLAQVNRIVHPAVKEYITERIDEARRAGRPEYLFIEAALLIEEGYGPIVDEMWYVHADAGIRRERLKSSRGYCDGKIDSIMREQLPEDVFYRHCSFVIENNGAIEDVYRQIAKRLGEE